MHALAEGLSELETLFGPSAAPVVREVRSALLSALAARDRGDAPMAVRDLQRAMTSLSRLFANVDPRQAAEMASMVSGLQHALLAGGGDEARRIAEEMRKRSGAVERPSRPSDEDTDLDKSRNRG